MSWQEDLEICLASIWVCLKMLAKPLNPMVFMIIIPFLNGYFIGNINPTFSVTNPFDGGFKADITMDL